MSTRLSNYDRSQFKQQVVQRLELMLHIKQFPIAAPQLYSLLYSPVVTQAANLLTAQPYAMVGKTYRVRFVAPLTIEDKTKPTIFRYSTDATNNIFWLSRGVSALPLIQDGTPNYDLVLAWAHWYVRTYWEWRAYCKLLDKMSTWANTTGQLFRLWPGAAAFVPRYKHPPAGAVKSKFSRPFTGDLALLATLDNRLTTCKLLRESGINYNNTCTLG